MWSKSRWCTAAYRFFNLQMKSQRMPMAGIADSGYEVMKPHFHSSYIHASAQTKAMHMRNPKLCLLKAYQPLMSFSQACYSSGVGLMHSESRELDMKSSNFNCSGCGASLQASDPKSVGYIPVTKLEELQKCLEQSESSENTPQEDVHNPKKVSTKTVICQRCFSLMHYNTALNITLKPDDYLTYLRHLKDKRALVLLMIDVVDFPGSLFPNLNTLISPTNPVMIVANKIDLFPRNLAPKFWKNFEAAIINECQRSNLTGCKVNGVHFVSAKSGQGIEELAESILTSWGNRGDVYLLGCTNVGKSTLFNKLLVTICGAVPGKISMDGNTNTPSATISWWPGTTLGLLSFPIMSIGKRRRLLAQTRKREMKGSVAASTAGDFLTSGEELVCDEEEVLTPREAKQGTNDSTEEVDKVLMEVGLFRERKRKPQDHELPPQNRNWLHDTPGAINDAQLINLLNTNELRLFLPKKPLKPQTFILKPGQTMFLGGLARLDYHHGQVSAYFTVFAAPYLPIHTTKIEKADEVYARNVGTHLLKIPVGDSERLAAFPALQSQELTLRGTGWTQSTADVVLSSAGWVGVMVGSKQEVTLRAYTPGGKGIYLREPALFPDAVQERGKRSQKGNRTVFKGR